MIVPVSVTWPCILIAQKQKVALAKQLNLRPRQVEVWFQNRRARLARTVLYRTIEYSFSFLNLEHQAVRRKKTSSIYGETENSDGGRCSRARRTKLKQTEVDCEFLKRCCDALTEENRRLQRELRALKFAVTAPPPPFYTQTPPSAPPASTTACATRTGPASRRAGPPPTATCSTPSPTPPPASAAANRARTVRATSDTIIPSSRFFIWGPGNS
jgi:homeobox-leucine zipper protein